MKMKLTPMPKTVIIKPWKFTQKTESGIIIPESAMESSRLQATGEILAIGTATEDYKVGDTVLFRQNFVQKIEDGTETFYVVPQKDIMAVLED